MQPGIMPVNKCQFSFGIEIKMVLDQQIYIIINEKSVLKLFFQTHHLCPPQEMVTQSVQVKKKKM